MANLPSSDGHPAVWPFTASTVFIALSFIALWAWSWWTARQERRARVEAAARNAGLRRMSGESHASLAARVRSRLAVVRQRDAFGRQRPGREDHPS